MLDIFQFSDESGANTTQTISKFKHGKLGRQCNFESIRSLFGRDVGAQTNDETEWENKRRVVLIRMLIRGRKLATNIFTADIFIFIIFIFTIFIIFISFLNSSAESLVGLLT